MTISCRKPETEKRAYELTVQTFYRVAPIPPVPLEVNGVNYFGTAYFPGAGMGTGSYIGKCTNYFNQLVYSSAVDGAPEGSVAAPVRDVPTYPIIGGPLPLIQPGDFAALGQAVAQVPREIGGRIINSIIVNESNDAIYTSAIRGSGSTFPISAVLVGFNGKALIVGGSGKFQHATGEVEYNGYFNVANPNDALYHEKGWISY